MSKKYKGIEHLKPGMMAENVVDTAHEVLYATQKEWKAYVKGLDIDVRCALNDYIDTLAHYASRVMYANPRESDNVVDPGVADRLKEFHEKSMEVYKNSGVEKFTGPLSNNSITTVATPEQQEKIEELHKLARESGVLPVQPVEYDIVVSVDDIPSWYDSNQLVINGLGNPMVDFVLEVFGKDVPLSRENVLRDMLVDAINYLIGEKTKLSGSSIIMRNSAKLLNIPEYEDAEAAVDNKSATPIDRFIYEYEPADASEGDFRCDLQELIDYVRSI